MFEYFLLLNSTNYTTVNLYLTKMHFENEGFLKTLFCVFQTKIAHHLYLSLL